MTTDAKSCASRIKAVALDSLGVLFSESVLVHPKDGELLRQRSHIDGQGISYLRAAGIQIAFITSEKTGFVEYLGEKLNALPSVVSGVWKPIEILTGQNGADKPRALEEWSKRGGFSLAECAYMGDDIGDLAVAPVVGLFAAPVQAEESVKQAAHFTAARRGGDGAVRDLANFILSAQNIDPATLSRI